MSMAVVNEETPLLLSAENERRNSVAILEADEERIYISGFMGSCFCHPQALCHRLIGLFLMCCLGLGSYFCYDNPGALQNEIKDAMNINTYQFANLYAWYAWPNVILPIIGGYLMDAVFGIRVGTVIFAVFIVLGQLLFSLGGFAKSYILMQIGRFVFGIGGESLAVAQNTYAVQWFMGKELNMVFGFQLSVARVGSTVNFLLMNPLYEWLCANGNRSRTNAIGWTLLIAGSACLLTLVSAVILGFMDKRREKFLRYTKENKDGKAEQKPEMVKASDVLTFPAIFWLSCAIGLTYYAAIFPFISLGQVYFIKKYAYTATNASFITGLIYLISAVGSPILGLLIDKTGRNISYIFLAVLATSFSHIWLCFSFYNPYIPIIILGIAYSLLASALWPIVALTIPEHQLGTAYGLMQAIQNGGLAIINMISGILIDSSGYVWLEIFFLFWLLLTLMATILMWLVDIHVGDGYVNMTTLERQTVDTAKVSRLKTARLHQIASVAAFGAPAVVLPPFIGLRPRSATELRLRYLHRVSAALPSHLGHSDFVVRPDETLDQRISRSRAVFEKSWSDQRLRSRSEE